MTHTLHLGDCLEVLRTMPACSVDAVVTDPPYGLAFMGKRWDYDVPSVEVWAECLRVLKPGGHLLAFAGTRTQHRMACRIEDAGFEIRDMIAWVYGSGFNKVGYIRGDDGQPVRAGWGGSLKPALEPITMARKPFPGTVAANVLEHGTGALNVDGCRVDASDGRPLIESKAEASLHAFGNGLNGSRCAGVTTQGRWPANLIHDGSDEVVGLFPADAGGGYGKRGAARQMEGWGMDGNNETVGFGDSGSAARFFYTAKATRAERQGVTHPTVKPLNLMAYLCRLVTPPGGIVLDPFMGSGTTIKAAIGEGFQAIGIERDPAYFEMARHRMDGAQLGLSLEAA